MKITEAMNGGCVGMDSCRQSCFKLIERYQAIVGTLDSPQFISDA